MYKSIHVKNFRGLRDLAITDLGRVNLIVGDNRTGKTSLLEALYLFQGAGSPALTFPVAISRGFPFVPQSAELAWQLLFHNTVSEHPIEIKAVAASGETTALTIASGREPLEQFLANGDHADGPALGRISDPLIGTVETLTYAFESEAGQTFASKATLRQGQPSLQVSPEANRPGVLVSTESNFDGELLAAWFTQMQDRGQLETLVLGLRAIEPQLVGLSLGFSMPERQPLIRGHVKNRRPMPLPLLGGGIARLAKMLLAVVSVSGGLALIDEVDTGLYHRHLTDAWRALDVASFEADVQVIATTHSWECIAGALAAFGDVSHTSDFRLHRLERTADGHRVVTYTHEIAQAAFEMNLEVR
jgi:hypothetical protein